MTEEIAGKRWTEGSLRTFLKGSRNENWALGILRASMPAHIQEALQLLSYSYGNTPRFDFLRRACGVA